MFSLTLVAQHNASNETFQVHVGSLPSVSEMLEGLGGYLEEKYGVQFPQIPDLFNACEDPPADNDNNLLPSPSVALPPPGATIVEEPPSTVLPSSTDASSPSFSSASTSSSTKFQALLPLKPYQQKEACLFCGKEVAKSNIARHLKIHAEKSSWLKCDFPPCLYATPRKDDLERHRELNHLSR